MLLFKKSKLMFSKQYVQRLAEMKKALMKTFVERVLCHRNDVIGLRMSAKDTSKWPSSKRFFNLSSFDVFDSTL